MAHIDWLEVEHRLVDLARYEVRRFLEDKRDEKFYGFGFACNAYYGEVLLYANTSDALRVSAEWSMSNYPNLDCYAGKSLSEVEDLHRWEMGNWKYDGFNALSEEWADGWEDWQMSFQKLLEGLYDENKEEQACAMEQDFLETCCRALISLESQPEFIAIPKETNFRTVCDNHDEAESEGVARLSRIRGARK